jgi:hypothetical protein
VSERAVPRHWYPRRRATLWRLQRLRAVRLLGELVSQALSPVSEELASALGPHALGVP